jgi:hypothetical protein
MRELKKGREGEWRVCSEGLRERNLNVVVTGTVRSARELLCHRLATFHNAFVGTRKLFPTALKCSPYSAQMSN